MSGSVIASQLSSRPAFARVRINGDGGQQYSADLGYIPLPDNVIAKVNNAIDSIS